MSTTGEPDNASARPKRLRAGQPALRLDQDAGAMATEGVRAATERSEAQNRKKFRALLAAAVGVGGGAAGVNPVQGKTGSSTFPSQAAAVPSNRAACLATLMTPSAGSPSDSLALEEEANMKRPATLIVQEIIHEPPGPLRPQPPETDAIALDLLTNIKKISHGYAKKIVVTNLASFFFPSCTISRLPVIVAVDTDGREKGNRQELHHTVQLPTVAEEKWTTEQKRAYIQGVLKGFFHPHFIVNVNQAGRLLSGIQRFQALRNFFCSKLSVVVGGKEIFCHQLASPDLGHFGNLPVTVTVYQNLTQADEIELLQALQQTPSWQ